MSIVLYGLGAIFFLVSFGCWLLVTIQAFQDEIWKGILCILGCGLYFIYFALLEFEEDRKWLILGGWVLGAFLGEGCVTLAQQMH